MKKIAMLLIVFLTACSSHRNELIGEEKMSLSIVEKLQAISDAGNSDDMDSEKILAIHINDDDPKVSSSACYYLGYIGSRKYIDQMLELLKADDEEALNLCLSGLAFVFNKSDHEHLEELYKFLSNSSLLVRMSAIESIGKIGSESSVEVLLNQFLDEKLSVKMQIAIALGNIGSTDALPLLKSFLDEIEEMDFSTPRVASVRGDDPHPEVLRIVVSKAILDLESKS